MLLKNRFLKLFAYATLCFVITGTVMSQDTPAGIVESFKKGNARELARHFNNNIELVVLDNEDVYSKSQAELILRDFFSVNPPVKFDMLHQGGPKASRFGIGNLQTKNGNFRIHFLLRLKDNIYLIHLLRIEKIEGAFVIPEPDNLLGD
ncbi:MAG: DUF4783 domain-containing protein [Bacteroidales bacterium]